MTRRGRPPAMSTEERRKEIFSAAEKLFGSSTYEKVTMAAIAAEAGMSKKTLYVHFADKEALLRGLVASSYIWSDEETSASDPVDAVKLVLRTIADHVLSERHLNLCRIAIAENADLAGLSDTFYQMGIQTGRKALEAAVQRVPPARQRIKASAETVAGMLFGASISRPMIDALMIAEVPDIKAVTRAADAAVRALFTD